METESFICDLLVRLALVASSTTNCSCLVQGEGDVLRATLRESREAQEETLAEQSAQLTHEMQSRAREQVAPKIMINHYKNEIYNTIS